MKIKVSNKWLKKKFRCDDYMITEVCHGICCKGENSKAPLLKEEVALLNERLPNSAVNYEIVQPKGICPFQETSGKCSLHHTNLKPLSCRFAPFTLNKNKTLVVSRRYLGFPCFNREDGKPAYLTYKDDLTVVFGIDIYNQMKERLDSTEEDFYLEIPKETIDKLDFLSAIEKRG